MKRLYLLLIAVIMLVLSGCASIDGYLESAMEKQSEMKMDPDYKDYQAYAGKGSLDQDG